MKKCYLILLVLLFSCGSVYADVFTGEWRLFVNSSGTEIPDNQPSIGLSISQVGTFYNVQVGLPAIPQTPQNAKTQGGWEGYLQAAQDQIVQMKLMTIRDKYSGKYMLSDDGARIEHLNGAAALSYKKTGDMLHAKDLGVFKKGPAGQAEQEAAQQARHNARAEALRSWGAMMSAMTVYYGDKGGQYPTDLKQLIPRYLTTIPSITIEEHPATNKVVNLTNCTASCQDVTNSGGWLYCADPKSKYWGTLMIDSDELNMGGKKWCSYGALEKPATRQNQASIDATDATEAARNPQPVIGETIEIKPHEEQVVELNLPRSSNIDISIEIEDPTPVAGGDSKGMTVVLLDETGFIEWNKLPLAKPFLDTVRRKNTETIQNGPCDNLLKNRFQSKLSTSCNLNATKYYFVFYDAWPGPIIPGQKFSETPVKAIFRVFAKDTPPTENAESRVIDGSNSDSSSTIEKKTLADKLITMCGSNWTQNILLQWVEITQAVSNGISFNAACKAHDECYDKQDPSVTREYCDNLFKQIATETCKGALVDKDSCLLQRDLFYNAIRKGGDGAYCRARGTCAKKQ